MKKLFTAMLAGLSALGACAAELDILPMYAPDLCWSGASMTDHNVTWAEGWGGLVFNLENKDYSAYNYVVIDFAEPTSAKCKLEAYYAAANEAASAVESDAASTQIIMKLDEAQKSDICKIALMAAKPSQATISKAVLVDELETNPVLFEGSVAVPDMKKVYFKIGADKFISLKKDQVLTIYFTCGDLQQYASVDLYSNNKKLACQNVRTNTKKDGQFALDATETSAKITEDSDITSLQTYGLQVKGRNVTITKVTLTDGAPDPVEPDQPDDPDDPTGNILWSGSVSTGSWANDVTVDAPKFASFNSGDKLAVYLTVDAGKDFGNIELDDQKYTKLSADGTSAELDNYGCVQADVNKLTYEIGASDLALLKANGLRVKGANITVTKIERIAGEGGEGGEGGEQGSTDIWTGSVSTGSWTNDVTVDAPKFASVKGGDIISVYLSVDAGKDFGNIELDDQKYTKLATDGTATGLDSYGCVQPGVVQLDYVLTNTDATLLKANGLRVKGANITITRVVLTTGEALPDDPQPTDETVLWSGSVNCGQWASTVFVEASKWADAKAGDKFKVNLSINAGKGKGIVKVQSGNGVDLEINNKGTNMDSNGNFVRGAQEAVYAITEADLEALKAHGLLISGFAVTVTKVTLQKMDTSGIDEVEAADSEAPVEYYNLQGVRVDEPAAGLYIRRQGNKVSKVYIR